MNASTGTTRILGKHGIDRRVDCGEDRSARRAFGWTLTIQRLDNSSTMKDMGGEAIAGQCIYGARQGNQEADNGRRKGHTRGKEQWTIDRTDRIDRIDGIDRIDRINRIDRIWTIDGIHELRVIRP